MKGPGTAYSKLVRSRMKLGLRWVQGNFDKAEANTCQHDIAALVYIRLIPEDEQSWEMPTEEGYLVEFIRYSHGIFSIQS